MDNINAIATIKFYEEKIKESEKVIAEETDKQRGLDVERAGEFIDPAWQPTNEIIKIHKDMIRTCENMTIDLQKIIYTNANLAIKLNEET